METNETTKLLKKINVAVWILVGCAIFAFICAGIAWVVHLVNVAASY